MKKSFATAAVMAASFIFFGCGNGDDNAASPGSPDAQADVTSAGDGATVAPLACTNVVSEANCDKTLRPFVFVHGTYGSGDNFAHVAALLESNGYCPDHIVSVEYDSVFTDMPGLDCTSPNNPVGCGKIDAVVNQVLAKFPQFTQVDLAGHSQGTQWCGDYIGAGGVGAHANKVAHYINFSGTPNVGDVQTLSISSQHDLGGRPNHATGTSVCTIPFPDGADAGANLEAGASADATTSAEAGASDAGAAPACNVKQVTFINQDHFACAASTDTFIQLYRYLNGKDPMYTTVQCGDDPVTIVGVAETFADNVPVAGKIEVREMTTTPRANGAPDMVITGDATGAVGPIQLKRGAYYEFAGYDATGKLIGYSYFTPFLRSNYLVRFLSPANNDGAPQSATVAAMSTGKFVRTANSTDIVARWSGGAFRQDLGASLMIDGSEVLASGNAGTDAFSASSSLMGGVVGLFMYDANKNGMTDLGLVSSAPFLSFTDVFVDAKTPKIVELSLTPGSEEPSSMGNKLTISNWPSSGALVNVFFQ